MDTAALAGTLLKQTHDRLYALPLRSSLEESLPLCGGGREI